MRRQRANGQPGWIARVLDRTAEIVAQNAEAGPSGGNCASGSRQLGSAVRRVLSSVWHFFVAQRFFSLTRRIVFLSPVGRARHGVLTFAYRAGLIDARATC
jgi:hypothetical protein